MLANLNSTFLDVHPVQRMEQVSLSRGRRDAFKGNLRVYLCSLSKCLFLLGCGQTCQRKWYKRHRLMAQKHIVFHCNNPPMKYITQCAITKGLQCEIQTRNPTCAIIPVLLSTLLMMALEASWLNVGPTQPAQPHIAMGKLSWMVLLPPSLPRVAEPDDAPEAERWVSSAWNRSGKASKDHPFSPSAQAPQVLQHIWRARQGWKHSINPHGQQSVRQTQREQTAQLSK